MHKYKMFFILYNSGAGGDMVSAVIDKTNYQRTPINIQATAGSLRQHLKTSIIEYHKTYKSDCSKLFFKGFEGNTKTPLLIQLEQKYLAITTGHDIICLRNHINIFDLQTIVIDDTDDEYNKWGMNRCYKLMPKDHPPLDEEEIFNRKKRINLAKTYKNSKVISLKDILEGRLITRLQEFIDTPLNTEIYDYWLSTILPKTPFNNN
jgi:hypothetical protein